MPALPKKMFLLVLGLLTAHAAHAGVVGWLTAKDRSWNYVQQTGGIRIGQPTTQDGKVTLPVDYDPTGVTGVTVRPTVMNSGQAVRRIEAKRVTQNRIVLTVVTQVVEEKSKLGRAHLADLSAIGSGAYDVFYEDAGATEKFLGRINIP